MIVDTKTRVNHSGPSLLLLTSCPWLIVCLVFELVISGIFNELVKITPPSWLPRHLYFTHENIVKTLVTN